jgi:carbonic anhydrase/acetyltransferase-like protein (isoleucine patch superfamily)
MTLIEFEGRRPTVDPTAFVAPTATLVGDVVVGPGASIWYGAVLRGDYGTITVGPNANVQDNAVLHCTTESPTVLEEGASVAHNCVVHGATIGKGAVVANGSIVLDGATIGAGSIVAAGSVVAAKAEIPPKSMVAGAPAQVKRDLTGTPAEWWVEQTGPAYAELAVRHRDGTHVVTDD